VRDVKEENPWFEWNGNEKLQPIIEILPKRHTYDIFQNVSCKAISESKLTCNSNVSVITDEPVGQCQFTYIMKSTQDDDTAAYAEVENSIKAIQCWNTGLYGGTGSSPRAGCPCSGPRGDVAPFG
jgi:hypothetical protein